jgi:hypothetical protein
MKWYVIENEDKRKYMTSSVSENIFIEKGWGNGYVAVPPNHSLHLGDLAKISTEVISELLTLIQNLDVHGGLTYNDNADGVHAPKNWWVFGFDTAHSGDTIEKWPKEAVEAETKRLFCQLLDIELGEL